MNTQLDELIARHLNGTLEEDEKLLLAMLIKVPENQLYLASKIDEELLDEDLGEEADDAIGASMFQRIQGRIQQNKQAQVHFEKDPSGDKVVQISWYKRNVVRWMAVASIILIISFVVLYNNNKSNEPSIAVQQSNQPTDSALSFVRHEVNTTGKEKRIQLADGSLIVLADNSEITFREPFIDKRDIILRGKASFKVAKDEMRPFTVISGAIATTALGTEFTITAFAQAKQITARLYEGRIVVRPVEKGNWRMKSEVYLLPGQELIYSDDALAKVRAYNRNSDALEKISSKELSLDDPSIPENSKGSWYMFNNQSLDQVLNQLAGLHNVKIVYNKKDVQNIYFTGKYDRSDPLEIILKRIGLLNKMTITRKDSAFVIIK
jgi:transmembrane sensor